MGNRRLLGKAQKSHLHTICDGLYCGYWLVSLQTTRPGFESRPGAAGPFHSVVCGAADHTVTLYQLYNKTLGPVVCKKSHMLPGVVNGHTKDFY